MGCERSGPPVLVTQDPLDGTQWNVGTVHDRGTGMARQVEAEVLDPCLRSFYSSGMFAVLKEFPSRNWLDLKDFSSFYLDGTKMRIVVHFSFRTADGITIVDQKTGERGRERGFRLSRLRLRCAVYSWKRKEGQ